MMIHAASTRSAAMTVRKPESSTMHFTSTLAVQNAAWTFDDLPPDARMLVRQCLLDWIAVALSGAREPLTHMLAEEAREQGGHPQATVVGHGFATSCRQAALINGAASHALDYDDVNMSYTGHPTVVLVPALLALAEARGASGAEFMTAPGPTMNSAAVSARALVTSPLAWALKMAPLVASGSLTLAM